MHQPRADIRADREYVKRQGAGRALLRIGITYKTEIKDIAEYLKAKYKEDVFVNIFKCHEKQ
jgi:hypothetical protein